VYVQTDSDLSSLSVENRGKSNLLLLIIAAVIVAGITMVLF
jgi:hypothetical protein